MPLKHLVYTLLCFTYLFSNPAHAARWLDCPALLKESSYEGQQALKYLVPGKKNWIFISKKDFKNDFELNANSLKALSDLTRTLKENGTTLVLMIVPPRGLVHRDKIDMTHPLAKNFNVDAARKSYRNMIAQLRAENIAVAPAPNFETLKDYGYAHDHHWNAAGAKMMAKLLSDTIKEQPVYQSVSTHPFSMKTGQKTSFKGSFFNPIKDICHVQLPPHQITEEISVNAQTDLLGNAPPPPSEITLIGTSFSEAGKSKAHFAEYLRADLSSDIDNRALGGGGISKSIFTYLQSNDFKQHPAKILIWEIPGFYSLNREKIFKTATKYIQPPAK